MSNLIVQYKFDKSIYDNLIPEFNTEFTNYEIIDEYLDTEDIVTTSTETIMIMNYDAEPDEYGILTTEYEVENVSTFSAENIVTRSIYSDELPTIIRFGNSKDMDETPKTLCVLEILYLNTNNVTDMYYMFKNCSNLTSIDVSNFDTSNVNNMANMFYGCNLLTSLDVSNWDTGNVTNMDQMFYDCPLLTSLDVSNFDTSNVTNMFAMFAYCNNLTSLDLSNFNTSNVTNMSYMFYDCNNLTSLDVSNFDTRNVTDMSWMFFNCNKLTSLDVSNWDTSKVTNMNYMFSSCSSLTELDLTSFDTSKVTNMGGMFENCSGLTDLDVSSFDTSNATDIWFMFSNCASLTELDVSGFDTTKATVINAMFQNCSKLTSLDLSGFDTTNVTSMYNMFYMCSNLTSLDLSGFDTTNVDDMSNMFQRCSALKYLKCNNVTTLNIINTLLPTKTSDNQGTIICKSDTTNLDTTALQSKYWNILDEPTLIAKYVFDKSIYNNCIPIFNTEFEGYFIEDEVEEGNNEVTRTIESCGMLPTKIRFSTCAPTSQGLDGREKALLELLYLDTNNLTTEAQMFQSCINLTYVNTENMINLHQTNHMFCDCNKLTSLDTSNFNTGNVTNISYMFSYCYELTSLDISNFDTSNVTDMYCMFYNCKSLTLLDLSNWDTSKVTNMKKMFYNCTKLTTLDVSNFNTSSVTDMTEMFNNTPLLTDISVLYMDKSSLQKLVDAMPTDSNKTLWYKDVNIDGITHGNNITLKKYMEGNVEIVLNSPLLEGDRIEVKDGKLCHYHKMGMVVLDGSEDEPWMFSYTFKNGIKRFRTNNSKSFIALNSKCICNNFWFDDKLTQHGDALACALTEISHPIYEFQANLSESLSNSIGNDVNKFRKWLSENPTTVIYELAEPYYEDITNLQSAPTLKTYLECSMEIDTDLPIDTNVTYRTNLSSVYVMERELDELDNGTDLGDILEGEVNE